MDMFCEICGKRWDSLSPHVRFVYGDGRWECQDETECFKREGKAALGVHADAARKASPMSGIDQDLYATWRQLQARLKEIREWADQLDDTDRAGLLAILDRPRETS